MSTNLSFTVRCSSKNLMPDDGSGVEKTVAQMQVIPDKGGSTGGQMGLSYATDDDQLTVGGYYNVTMVDGTAPAKKAKA